jgi:hypothetical protein
MSYDISFFRLQPGLDLPQSYEKLRSEAVSERKTGNRKVFTPEENAIVQEIVAALRAHEPALEYFEAEHHIELTEESTGIQISFCPGGSGSASMAYGHDGEEAEKCYRKLQEQLRIVGLKGDYYAYDPQIDNYFDLKTLDIVSHMLGKNEYIRDKMDKYITKGDTNQKKPWWRFW